MEVIVCHVIISALSSNGMRVIKNEKRPIKAVMKTMNSNNQEEKSLRLKKI